ncbi:hypothetical protein M2139_000521 [Enterococcus sp. PF1-24]|uniref:class II lanthipeptide, LchA2/BrtA2 family n=1 Tax=unclassified Enterococcus TaxID=2608891 RepID=UPI002477239C|nr:MULTISPECIES: class II lanthipeptide, LchA2/BrtA2 family [unclassified Enterococcus]MDH6363684.1 hypothetical protein [Enterococcus sp. PFB1-1]MDH6400640.1 hypothetical protein [Enterococcus sp. PF1-24]
MSEEKKALINSKSGLIPEEELQELIQMDNAGGGVTASSWVCGLITGIVTRQVCGTSVCTQSCS